MPKLNTDTKEQIKKLHEDYRLDYKDKINGYLEILHKNANHNDTVYDLPLEI